MIGWALNLVKLIPASIWRNVALGAAGLAAIWYIWDAGRDATQAEWEAAEARQALAVALERNRQLSALQAAADEAVRASQRERQQTTIIRERILQVTDEAACLDEPVPPGVIDALRR